MTASFPSGGTEYGGRPGLIQPLPHDVADHPKEAAALAIRTDPADPTSSPETVLAAERKAADRRAL